MKNTSIQTRLALLILFATLFALVLAFASFGVYERASFRRDVARQLSTLADTLGANTAASLAFDDSKSAADLLSALKADPGIQLACLYDNRGTVFAIYRRKNLPAAFASPALQADGAYFQPQSLALFRAVSLNGEKAGSIAIVSDLSAFRSKTIQYLKIAGSVLFFASLITYLISIQLLRAITNPLLLLAGVATRISCEQDTRFASHSSARTRSAGSSSPSIKCWSTCSNAIRPSSPPTTIWKSGCSRGPLSLKKLATWRRKPAVPRANSWPT